jgi:hypothetical protein
MPFTNTHTGEVVDETKDSVCPLVQYLGQKDGDPKYRFSGSAFYVSGRGIALTAMHCLVMPSDGMWAQQDGPLEMYVTRLHPDGENCYKIELVHVAQGFGAPGLDIAILAANTSNGIQKQLAISAVPPKIGDKIFCYSCPNLEGQIDNISGKLHIDHADFEGEITQHFPDGRGKIFPGQCYEAHMSAPGGTSGGPVFNSQGHVIGVISSGMAGMPPISYFAPLAPMLDVEFELLTDEGIVKHSLRSLAKLGLITIFDSE